MSDTTTEFQVTREFLEDLDAHPEKIDDPTIVTPEIFETVKPFMLREVEWPSAATVEETEEERIAREANEAAAAAAEPAARAAAAAEETDDVTPRLTALESAWEKRKTAVAAADAILNEPDLDYLEDEDAYRAQQARKAVAQRQRNAAMDEYQDIQHAETVTPLSKRKAESVESKFYREAEAVAQHFPAIKVSKGLRAAEKEAIPYFETIYKAFNGGTLDGLTAEIRDQAWTKYNADPAFRKTLPAAPADFENTALLLEAKEMVSRVGGTLRGAIADLMIERGLYGKTLDEARRQGARSSAEKIQEAVNRQSNEVVAAPVGGGGGTSPKPMVVPFDKASAEKYVNNYLDKSEKNHALTDFEKIHLTTAKTLLGLEPIDI